VETSPEERVWLDARHHGVALAAPLSRALGLSGAGAVLLTLAWPFAVAGAVAVTAGALIALRAVWVWEATHLVVTDQRVYVVEGTLRRRARAVRLHMINAVELEQSLPGRLLDYGTVVVGPLELEHVSAPRRVHQLVERLAS
jgi:uncharacterized membrane protein YdbT with pleckstrin-like domain